jgi:DNA repair protein RecO (recombination protein O)
MSSSFFHRTEGVILRTIPIQDYKQLLTLFTLDYGLIKILYNRKKNFPGAVHPLSHVEVIFREKNSEIFPCEELTLWQPYLRLRDKLPYLEVACDLLKMIERSQLLGKKAPMLYRLFLYYLDKIPFVSDPYTLIASFRLKLLKHEGILTFPFTCAFCQKVLISTAFGQGAGLFCLDHRPKPAFIYGEDELQMMSHLTLCQKLTELLTLQLHPDLLKKIEVFFEEQIKSN